MQRWGVVLTGRTVRAGLGRSPFEVAGIAVLVAVMAGVGVLWGVGVVIGSILGSALAGSGGEGVAAMLRSFPDVGRAWEPPISSALVWGATLLLVAAFTPLVWRLARAGRLAEEGAQWATAAHLQRAGLLVKDEPLPHARVEEPADAE
jgi:hypothetical protein